MYMTMNCGANVASKSPCCTHKSNIEHKLNLQHECVSISIRIGIRLNDFSNRVKIMSSSDFRYTNLGRSPSAYSGKLAQLQSIIH